ncbi:3629_t:CDS:2 [Paraglomus brasilianum]|uniref:3629_t:CDS:1 n=1 Tax=Paraglomus brasilianum TaxID=144538 RepID=A0A9N8W3J2_9GLOM|nr:3629_t:CDS:2 [Paraglomus brasilianum]
MLDYRVVLGMLLLTLCMISHGAALPITDQKDTFILSSANTDDPSTIPGQSLRLPSIAPIVAAVLALLTAPVMLISALIIATSKSR